MIFTAYSFLDLVSASGGIITGMFYIAAPIAMTFSKMSFDLGVMKLLFMAKTFEKPKPMIFDESKINPRPKAKPSIEGKLRYKHVKISNIQFLRLFWREYGP